MKVTIFWDMAPCVPKRRLKYGLRGALCPRGWQHSQNDNSFETTVAVLTIKCPVCLETISLNDTACMGTCTRGPNEESSFC
jgi:hypothetical protein